MPPITMIGRRPNIGCGFGSEASDPPPDTDQLRSRAVTAPSIQGTLRSVRCRRPGLACRQ